MNWIDRLHRAWGRFSVWCGRQLTIWLPWVFLEACRQCRVQILFNDWSGASTSELNPIWLLKVRRQGEVASFIAEGPKEAREKAVEWFLEKEEP